MALMRMFLGDSVSDRGEVHRRNLACGRLACCLDPVWALFRLLEKFSARLSHSRGLESAEWCRCDRTCETKLALGNHYSALDSSTAQSYESNGRTAYVGQTRCTGRSEF
jgi:hypothetical protein